jgi:chromosome segregation ATPase
MLKKTLRRLCLLLLIAVVMFACGSKEKEDLRSQVDSLKRELQTSQEMAETLTEVGTLMDSIDASRQLLRVNMVEGTSYDDYQSRMKDLNSYVQETQQKIDGLERSLKQSRTNSALYVKTINKLKQDLESEKTEIAMLQEQVDKYRSENENLINTVGLQEAEIADKQSQIEAKSQELALIEARIQELMIQSKVSEADAWFARARAVEEAADRTKLAPRKKKETLKEAVELYKKALSLGKTEAQAKIDELQKRL